jgi:hypothetical protein
MCAKAIQKRIHLLPAVELGAVCEGDGQVPVHFHRVGGDERVCAWAHHVKFHCLDLGRLQVAHVAPDERDIELSRYLGVLVRGQDLLHAKRLVRVDSRGELNGEQGGGFPVLFGRRARAHTRCGGDVDGNIGGAGSR